MKKNIHAIDRAIRLLFAALVALLYFTNSIHGTLALVLGVVAGILVLTALINFCPLYSILRISTKKEGSK
ncbi:MAG: DUF2892 domain-containing protein [Agriterribacter sp.]